MKKNLTLEEIYDLALQYHKKENYIDAINLYNKILEIEPNHFGSIVNLGVVLSTIEKYDLAKPLLEKAIEINSNNVDIYHYLFLVKKFEILIFLYNQFSFQYNDCFFLITYYECDKFYFLF